MRILHTSDWHLGKKTEGRDRLFEQAQALQEICALAGKRDAELILVCGDIFDTATPSADAEDLFYRAITELTDGGKRLVVVIAGNHDDPVRLCAASPLARRQSIIIAGGGEESYSLSGGSFKIIESGRGYIVIESGKGERAVLNCLAYPSDARLSEYREEKKSYYEKISGYLSAGHSRFSDSTINITLSHLFITGASVSGEEREIQLGGIRECAASVFSEKTHYVALGHIHKCQKMSEKVYYSGSILQYSCDEAQNKCVIFADITCGGVQTLEKIPLKSGKKVIRRTAASFDEAVKIIESISDYIYLTIKQNKPLEYSESKKLRSYENLLGIELEMDGDTECAPDTLGRRNRTPRELFSAYYRSRYNSEPPEELSNLFVEIAGSTEEEV